MAVGSGHVLATVDGREARWPVAGAWLRHGVFVLRVLVQGPLTLPVTAPMVLCGDDDAPIVEGVWTVGGTGTVLATEYQLADLSVPVRAAGD